MKQCIKLLVLSILLTGCPAVERDASKAILEKVVRNRAAAEEAAARARQAAKEAEAARLAHNLDAVKELEYQRAADVKEVDDLVKKMNEDRKTLEGLQDQQSADKALEESTRVEADSLVLRLDQDMDEDVKQIEGEEPSMSERCLKSTKALMKEMVCLYFKTYIKDDRFPNETEFNEQLKKSFLEICASLEEHRNWVKTSKAVASIVREIRSEPNNKKKFELAMVGYACELR